MARKKSSSYKAKHINILGDIDAVRKRPAMYIGDTGIRGLHHLLQEIVDNAVDEVLAGYCNEIIVTIYKDNSVSVKDNGRGIPVDIHPKAKIPAVQLVLTTLHAGGKFNKKTYAISGGLHGVGASVVNALSEYLRVEVIRDGYLYFQEYSRGKPITPLQSKKTKKSNGTLIHFKPDKTIFKNVKFSPETIASRLCELSYLIPKTKIILIDKINNISKTFISGGLADFLVYLRKQNKLLTAPFVYYKKIDDIELQIAFEYENIYNETIFSYVNTINTIDGGFHVTAFKSALAKAIAQYNRENNISKFEITPNDIREGLVAILHILIPDPQFEGQTKTKLGNSDIRTVLEPPLYAAVLEWLNKYPEYAVNIIRKAELTAKTRDAARRARDIVRKKSLIENTSLPGKLSDCIASDPKYAELFIVEGESAAGTMKMSRDRHTQAILPLRGKILNVEKSSINKILENEEIRTIITAIGSNILNDCDPKKARYNKIIIAHDADSDGAHILTLLLALFYRYMKPLIEAGYIYISMPPLYKVKIGKRYYYIQNDQELAQIQKRYKNKSIEIQRYKGLGEMNPDELWETVMNINTRKLKQVTIDDAEEAEKIFKILMGSNVQRRRKFIEENTEYIPNLDI